MNYAGSSGTARVWHVRLHFGPTTVFRHPAVSVLSPDFDHAVETEWKNRRELEIPAIHVLTELPSMVALLI